MKMVCDDRTLREVANEFLALKKAQKVRERTLNDYKKYIDKFLAQSDNSLDVDVPKIEILEYFADIPKTSPARFNHPYQYLHALFTWAAKQDYIFCAEAVNNCVQERIDETNLHEPLFTAVHGEHSFGVGF